MARRTVEVFECDICGSADDVGSYSITAPHGTSGIDLCGTHRPALEELFAAGRVRRRRRGRPPQTAAPAATAKPVPSKARPAAATKKARAQPAPAKKTTAKKAAATKKATATTSTSSSSSTGTKRPGSRSGKPSATKRQDGKR